MGTGTRIMAAMAAATALAAGAAQAGQKVEGMSVAGSGARPVGSGRGYALWDHAGNPLSMTSVPSRGRSAERTALASPEALCGRGARLESYSPLPSASTIAHGTFSCALAGGAKSGGAMMAIPRGSRVVVVAELSAEGKSRAEESLRSVALSAPNGGRILPRGERMEPGMD